MNFLTSLTCFISFPEIENWSCARLKSAGQALSELENYSIYEWERWPPPRHHHRVKWINRAGRRKNFCQLSKKKTRENNAAVLLRQCFDGFDIITYSSRITTSWLLVVYLLVVVLVYFWLLTSLGAAYVQLIFLLTISIHQCTKYSEYLSS